jgi:hypothetical protein
MNQTGKVPISSPIHKCRGDEARHEESLVRQRVKYRSRDRLLVKVSGDPAVEPVESRG